MSVNLVKQRFPQLLTALDRAPMAGLLCAAAILFGVALAWSRSAAMSSSGKTSLESASPAKAADSGVRLQDDIRPGVIEGGRIVDQIGYFQAAGSRLTFVSADNRAHFVALENQNLERVSQAIAESGQSQWLVSGTISHYRGEDFILLSQAELKAGRRLPDAQH
jgi:hypothetical protein